MRVLIVDDSLAFRSQIKRALTIPEIEVVGAASNGKVALDMLQADPTINLVTVDMNMPVMDGIATIREIKRLKLEVKIIVFASKTDQSARETLEALNLGADDFVVKPEAQNVSFDKAHLGIQAELLPKVVNILAKASPHKAKKVETTQQPLTTFAPKAKVVSTATKKNLLFFKPEIIVIASSTGGPSALEKFVSKVVERPPLVPVLIAQHMPENFTKHLADRLQERLKFPVVEGVNGEPLRAGKILIAPGNYHMIIKRIENQNKVVIHQEERVKNVRPAAELLFKSVLDIYGASTMAFVLTGMGDDGADGCEIIHNAGGGVMIQDKESSTVWGMPGAVYERNTFDQMGSIEECAQMFAHMTR